MAINISDTIAPAGSFAVVDLKDASGNVTGSNISASGNLQADGTLTVNSTSQFNANMTTTGQLTANSLQVGAVTSTGNLSTTGNLTVDGNLEVKGDTTVINTEVVTVTDPFLMINSGSAGSSKDAGIIVQSGSSGLSGSALFFDQSSNRWGTARGVATQQGEDSGNTIGTNGYGEINGHIPVVSSGVSLSGSNNLLVTGSDHHTGVGDFIVDSNNELWFRDS